METNQSLFVPGRLMRSLAAATVLLAPAAAIHAQNGTWTNLTGGSWATGANWSGGVIATNVGNTADFSQLTLTGATTVTLDGAKTIGDVIFGDLGNTYGWTLNTGSGGPLTLAVSTGTPTITVNGQTNTVGAVLTGAQGLLKAGAGTLVLTNVNTYTGGTGIAGGVLTVSGAGSLGSGSYAGAITNNGTLNYATSAAQTLSGAITGTGAVTDAGAGTLTLSDSANNFTGGVTVNQGSSVNGVAGGFGAGSITLNSGAKLGITSGTVTNTLNVVSGMSTNGMSSGLTYSGPFTGAGILFLTSGSYSYSYTYSSVANPGFTGTIMLQRGSTSGGYNFSAGAADWSGADFQFNSTSADTANQATFAGAGTTTIKSVANFGAAAIAIGSTTTLNIKNGFITRSNLAENVTPLIIPYTGGTARLTSQSGTLTFNCTNGAITMNSGVSLVDYNATTPLSLVLNGASTLTLGGYHTYSGTTTVNAGTMLFPNLSYALLKGAVSGAGTLSFTNGSTLDLTAAAADSLSVGSPLVLGGANVVCDLNSPTNAAVIAMTGSPTLLLGKVNTIVPSAGLTNGTYTLVSGAGTITGTAANLALAPVRGAAAAFTVSSPTVTMTVSGVTTNASLTWQGNVSGSWDVDGTQNWTNNISGAADYFYDLDAVTFPDGATTPTVTVTTNVSPVSVTFSGAATTYVLNGPGEIAGAATLAKTGAATLVIDNVNSFSGGSTISGGIVVLATNSALGTGPVTINSGTSYVTVNDGLTMGNNITINGGGTAGLGLIENSAGGVAKLGGGVITINGSPAAGGHLAATNTGTLQVFDPIYASVPVIWRTGTGAFTGGGSYTNFLIGAGTVRIRANNGLATNCVLGIGNSSAAVFDLSGCNQTLAGITKLANGATIGNGSAVSNSVLTLTGTSAYAGVIENAISPGTQQTLLTVNGGYLTLSGVNTYTGATTVTNGILEVDGSVAATPVAVQNGGTLQGVGSLGGPVTVAAGGRLLAGTNSVTGTLTINSTLTLAGTTSLRINKTGGVLANDEVTGLTGATFGGTLILTNVTSDGTPLAAGDTFTLFNKSSGSFSGTFALVLPALSSTNLAWSTNNLAGNGTVSVVGVGSAPLPLFSPAPGAFIGPVTLTVSGTNTTIYYTTDGSNPTNSVTVKSSNNVVTVSIPVNTQMTVLAYATEATYGNSAVVGGTYATMSEFIWTNTAGGSWAGGANWSNNLVAAGANQTADFSQMTMTSNTTITLDGSRTIGNLVFGDQGQTYNTIINNGSSGPLVLSGTNTPVLTVTNDLVTLNVTVNSTNGLVTTGNGTNVWAANPSISGGGIMVNGGMLESTQDDFGGTFTPLITVNTNATLFGNNYHAFGGGTTLVLNRGTYLLNYEDYKTNITMMDGLIAQAGGGDGAGLRVGFAGGNGTYTWTVTNSVAGSVVSAPINTIGSGVTLVWNVARGLAPYDLTVSGVMSSSGNLVFTGNGITALTAGNSYSGSTAVSNGTLEVDGSIGSSAALTVSSNATLSGTGSVSGPVAVLAGGRLAPGTGTNIGTLSVYNSMTLAGTAVFRISETGGTPANDEVSGMSSLTDGGMLVVTNVTADTNLLEAGDTFYLFSSAASGSFASVSLPPLPAGLSWDTTALLTGGYITVAANAGPPTFNPPAGTYVGATAVTISSTTPGATIYYTTNGTTPTGSSPSGITPVTVLVATNTSITIEAYAVAAGDTASPVETASYTTIGTPTWENIYGGSWANGGNWLSSYVPNGAGLTADFSELTLAGSPTYVTLDGTVTIGDVIFGDQANASTWNIQSGSGGPLTLNNGTNTPVIRVLNQATVIQAPLAGGSGLTTAGAGTLILSASNSYTGGTTVSAGTLQLGDGASYNGSVNGTITNDSTLVLANPLAQTMANVITGPGTVVMEGTATLALGGASTYTGNTVINYGTLSGVAGAFGTGNIDLTSNGVTLAVTAGTLTNTINITSGVAATYNLTSGLTHSGLFAGAGTLTIASSSYTQTRTFTETADTGFTGALVFQRGANNFTGTNANFSNADFQIVPTITGDTATYLEFIGGGTADIASISQASGGQLEIASNTVLNVVSGTINHGTASSQNLIIMPYSGTTGKLTSSGGTLTFGGSSGTIVVNAGVTLADYGVGSPLSLVQDGSETLSLLGTNTYTGATTVEAGTLELATPTLAANSTVTVAGGAVLDLNYPGTNVVGSLVLDGVTQPAGVYNSTTGSPYITGAGSLLVASSVATYPTNITYSVSGNTLSLNWPADHTGWRLLVQTNNLGAGISSNPADWGTVTGSAATNAETITINPTQPAGFYRLVYP